MSDEQVRMIYSGSALPGNGEVVVFVATAPTSGSMVGVVGENQGNFFQMARIRRIFVEIQNDQAGTLKVFQSVDRGANWVQVEPDLAVAAAAANSTNKFDYLVEQYGDWKLTWTNGAAPQTVFRVNIVGTGQRVIAN